jgi:hypothetical protein
LEANWVCFCFTSSAAVYRGFLCRAGFYDRNWSNSLWTSSTKHTCQFAYTKKAYIATIYNLMYLLLLRGAIIFSLRCCFFIQMMPPGSAAAFRFYDYQLQRAVLRDVLCFATRYILCMLRTPKHSREKVLHNLAPVVNYSCIVSAIRERIESERDPGICSHGAFKLHWRIHVSECFFMLNLSK